MNSERKEFNKYCGLIMFEPPSQPLNQSIAAGAADVDAFHSINYYNNNNNNNNEKLPGCLKIKNEKRPPRPPNAFILYRREKQPAILATNRHMTNAEISRYIANLWKNESNETRLVWERYADQQKLNHMRAYPNYVYRPNKSRNEKRRQQRRKQRKATAGSNNNNNDDDVDDTPAGSNIATPDISTPITSPIVDITNNTITPTNTNNDNNANNTTAAISMIPMSMGINNNNVYYNPPMGINNYFTQQQQEQQQVQNVRNNNNFGIVIPQQIVPSSYPISPSSYTSSPISTTSSSPSLNSTSSILSSVSMNHSNNENENNNYLYDNDNNGNNMIYDNNNNNSNNNNNLVYENDNICDDSVNGLGLGFSDFLQDPTIINTVYNPTIIDEILRMDYQNYLGGGI